MNCREPSSVVMNPETPSQFVDVAQSSQHRRSQPREDKPSRNELDGTEVGADALAQATGREVAW